MRAKPPVLDAFCAWTYAAGQGLLHAKPFSLNPPGSLCLRCHGPSRVYEVTDASMVPDPSPTIRKRAIAIQAATLNVDPGEK